MASVVNRRGFLKLTGASGGLAVLATRPARAGPKKAKILTDRGQAADRLTIAGPAGPGYSDTYANLY